jgi:hypothetical protein
MLHTTALAIVLLAGAYLVLLAAVAFFAPSRAARFLRGFAGNARLHYLELALRGVVGIAFVLQAPQMRFTDAFSLFGWMLLLTTAALLVLPWRVHRAFALRAIPYATRYLPLVAVASLLLGGLILAAALAGPIA